MLALLYRALAQPVGIVVRTNDPDRLRQRLYAARRESGDPGLAELSFIISPAEPNQIWIMNREALQNAEAKTGISEGDAELRSLGLFPTDESPPTDPEG